MTTCGFELEVSGGARNVVDGLRSLGLSDHTRLHAYHCRCSDCQPRPFFGTNQRWFKAQQDCTANGEFISGVFEYGRPELDEAILGLGHVLLRANDCATDGNVGNHVHVGRNMLGPAASLRLQRLFARYGPDLQEIAAGPRSQMRTYNGDFRSIRATDLLWSAERAGSSNGYDTNYLGSYLLAYKAHTVEFRLWNAVRTPWRIRTHVGLSVAFVDAAIAGQDCVFEDERPLEDVIGDFMDADTWAGVLRQRYSKGGLQ